MVHVVLHYWTALQQDCLGYSCALAAKVWGAEPPPPFPNLYLLFRRSCILYRSCFFMCRFFNCTVIPSNTVCVPAYEEGVDRVYVLDEDFFVDVESISNELEIVLMLIDEPCKTVLRRVMCFYFLPPCGKGTHFIPPQTICSEDCFNAMEVCPTEFIFLNNFIQAQNLEAAENATLGLNCSQPALFIDPLPHCCVAGTYIH